MIFIIKTAIHKQRWPGELFYLTKKMHTFRLATESDAEVIRSIAEKTWRDGYLSSREKHKILKLLDEYYSIQTIENMITEGNQQFLLMFENESPVCFVSWSVVASGFIIHQLYCLQYTQGKGYMKAILKEVTSIAQSAEKKSLEIKVNNHARQKRYYESLGFNCIGEVEQPDSISYAKELLMRKNL
jgi:acetyltransferase (GNAT) family protein